VHRPTPNTHALYITTITCQLKHLRRRQQQHVCVAIHPNDALVSTAIPLRYYHFTTLLRPYSDRNFDYYYYYMHIFQQLSYNGRNG